MSTLGERLKERRKSLRLTQGQVGKVIGVSASAVTLWEKDNTAPKGQNLFELCKILQCEPNWLLGLGNGEELPSEIDENLVIKESNKIPLLSISQVFEWYANKDFDASKIKEWRKTTSLKPGRTFALKVKGNSMLNPRGAPSIPEGAIVTVDPSAKPVSGKIVVVYLTDEKEVTIKKLEVDGPNTYLIPLNPDFRPIPLDGHYTIIGVVKTAEFEL